MCRSQHKLEDVMTETYLLNNLLGLLSTAEGRKRERAEGRRKVHGAGRREKSGRDGMDRNE